MSVHQGESVVAILALETTRLTLGGHGFGGRYPSLGLVERPRIGGQDVVDETLGLCALAERFREGEEKRDHRNQQGDLLVRARRMGACCLRNARQTGRGSGTGHAEPTLSFGK
jgi:hypothetical protein